MGKTTIENLDFHIEIPDLLNTFSGIMQAIGGVNSNIHNTREKMENIFLKRIDELDRKISDLREILKLILKKLE